MRDYRKTDKPGAAWKRLRVTAAKKTSILVLFCVAFSTLLVVCFWTTQRSTKEERIPQALRVEEKNPLPFEDPSKEESRIFLPNPYPKRFQASISINSMLEKCRANSGIPLRTSISKAMESQCSNRWSLEEFVCAMECPIEEPELENSFRILQTSKYTADYLWGLCRRGVVSALIWVLENEPRLFVCGGKDHVQGRRLFDSTRSLLSMMMCLGKIPNVLFALDNLDWAVPSESSDVPGWIRPLPGVVRYTGSPSHPTVLLPSDAFIRAAVHCEITSKDLTTKFQVCRQIDETPRDLYREWSSREKVMFWRGSSTGVPLEPLTEEYLPRPALIHKFFEEPGFDVGFVGGKPPSRHHEYGDFFRSRSKAAISSKDFTQYKFILHCDGHTASWGLAHKLTLKSAVVWIPSNFHYREFYYNHLRPWEHYIPVDSDLSNLKETKDWLFSEYGDNIAQAIGERARMLFETRLRPEATYCYLARLLYSLAVVQRNNPTTEHLASLGIPVGQFSTFEEYTRLTKG